MSDNRSGEYGAPALDRCACTHLRTWHHNYDGSGFVGVNRGACVADDCGCSRFGEVQ